MESPIRTLNSNKNGGEIPRTFFHSPCCNQGEIGHALCGFKGRYSLIAVTIALAEILGKSTGIFQHRLELLFQRSERFLEGGPSKRSRLIMLSNGHILSQKRYYNHDYFPHFLQDQD